MKVFEELFGLARQLEAAAEMGNAEVIEQPLKALKDAAHQVERAFSGSWLGYHSRVYYKDFVPPPPGANFSQEWGLKNMEFTSLGSRGAWREYSYADVEAHIEALAKHPNLEPARDAARQADEVSDKGKAEIISILETELAAKPDPFISKLKADLEKLEPMSQFDIARHWAPQGQIMTRDMIAMGQGNTVPAHINAAAKVASLSHSFRICQEAADIARKAASHLERKGRKQGINGSGQIVGYYLDGNGDKHGFLDSSGTYTTLDYPSARQTFAQGITMRARSWGHPPTMGTPSFTAAALTPRSIPRLTVAPHSASTTRGRSSEPIPLLRTAVLKRTASFTAMAPSPLSTTPGPPMALSRTVSTTRARSLDIIPISMIFTAAVESTASFTTAAPTPPSTIP